MPELPEPTISNLEGEPEDDLWDDDHHDLMYLKYMFDGAASIAELSASLRRLADDLDRQQTAGWRLASPVDSGYSHLTLEQGS